MFAGGIIDVEFDIEPGEVFGFLGPNGAGKTTTIRILLGLYRPTSGQMRVFGLDPKCEAAQILHRVGYIPAELTESAPGWTVSAVSSGFRLEVGSTKLQGLSPVLTGSGPAAQVLSGVQIS
ncbi:ATP-binding cassette domain-containing protein [Rhodococcus sp. OK302]|uniref:ATP-binding cassette domain-containing protein n=1 Tax=Rhodococcus sp. OK302 TaxID=1882769 RepID=UPI0026D39564|nr:ATP-binding cassette domain-containing protein [Rhodococcus sp. OK302]